MNKSISKTLIKAILLAMLVNLFFSLVSALYLTVNNEIHSYVTVDYFFYSWLIYFHDYYATALVFAIVAVYSVAPRYSKMLRRNLTAPTGSTLIPIRKVFSILVVTAILTNLLFDSFHPAILKNRTEAMSRSRILHSSLRLGIEARDNQQLEEAVFFFSIYLNIADDDFEVITERDQLVSKLTHQRQLEGLRPDESKQFNISRLSRNELYQTASRFFSSGDNSTAYYYILSYIQLYPDDQNARSLLASIKKRFEELSGEKLRSSQYDRFTRLNNGWQMLDNGDYFNGYFLARELRQEYPLNREIDKLYQEGVRKIASESYFIEELQRFEQLPTMGELSFIKMLDSGGFLALNSDRIIMVAQNYYLYDTEILITDQNGNRQVHLFSSYAKIIDNNMLLCYGLSKQDNSIFLPTVYRYSDNFSATYKLSMPYFDKGLFRLSNDWIGHSSDLSIPDQWQLIQQLPNWGHNPVEAKINYITRINNPLHLLTLSLLAILFGWITRNYSSKLSLFKKAGIPISLLVVYALLQRAQAVPLTLFLILQHGLSFIAVLITLALLYLLLIIFMLIILIKINQKEEQETVK